MSYLIGKKADCKNYDTFVSNKIGLSGTGYNWSEPRKHPERTEWAIQVHEVHTPESGNVVSKLPEDWTPKQPENI